MVCYKFAMTGECDNGKDCEYRHDPTLAQKYVMMKVKYFMDSVHWPKSNPRADTPRLSLFTDPKRDEVDWYEMQKIEYEEQLRLENEAEREADMQDGGEWDLSSVAAMDGDGAQYRN